jgi:hypothetical protein
MGTDPRRGVPANGGRASRVLPCCPRHDTQLHPDTGQGTDSRDQVGMRTSCMYVVPAYVFTVTSSRPHTFLSSLWSPCRWS